MKYKTDIQPMKISWQENVTPYSEKYDDIYFTPEHGLAESRHVFFDGNRLLERWRECGAGDTFTIFECGFGTSLNFLVTISQWLDSQAQGKLHYIALEKHPLVTADLERALTIYKTELQPAQQFIDIYPQLLKDRIIELTPNITLQLIVSDITAFIRKPIQFDAPFDAIYLDGFSPANNPEMWSDSVCHYLYANSKQGTTAATFSVSGMVKRNLKQAGFIVAKQPGYGKKREMLTAYKAAN